MSSETGLLVNNLRIFLVFLRGDPHLSKSASYQHQVMGSGMIANKEKDDEEAKPLTFLNAFRPAKIDPPIHVEYFRSGGA